MGAWAIYESSMPHVTMVLREALQTQGTGHPPTCHSAIANFVVLLSAVTLSESWIWHMFFDKPSTV
jgi:hypothetical protein